MWIMSKRLVKKEQFHASGLHSEKSQDYRFKLVSAFREGKVDVLVATDVGSRGLDFPEVAHVVNYDLPDSIEDYVHRCGRTGRMGHFGSKVLPLRDLYFDSFSYTLAPIVFRDRGIVYVMYLLFS